MHAERRENGDVKLEAITAGNVKSRHLPLVLLHGWGNDSRCWSPLVELLSGDYLMVQIDLPGFGVNATVECPDLTSLYAAIEDILPPRCHLVGWSLGGMICSQLASLYPQHFVSLTTIASNGKFVADATWPPA